MGFLDRLFSGKVSTAKQSSDWAAELTLGNTKYMLSELDWSFQEVVDSKNRPTGEIVGGLMSMTINEPVDQLIHNWIINVGAKHSGFIKFYSQSFDQGAQMEMKFEDAICVRYYKQLIESAEDVSTTLVISCKVMKFGNEIFEQRH